VVKENSGSVELVNKVSRLLIEYRGHSGDIMTYLESNLDEYSSEQIKAAIRVIVERKFV